MKLADINVKLSVVLHPSARRPKANRKLSESQGLHQMRLIEMTAPKLGEEGSKDRRGIMISAE